MNTSLDNGYVGSIDFIKQAMESRIDAGRLLLEVSRQILGYEITLSDSQCMATFTLPFADYESRQDFSSHADFIARHLVEDYAREKFLIKKQYTVEELRKVEK